MQLVADAETKLYYPEGHTCAVLGLTCLNASDFQLRSFCVDTERMLCRCPRKDAFNRFARELGVDLAAFPLSTLPEGCMLDVGSCFRNGRLWWAIAVPRTLKEGMLCYCADGLVTRARKTAQLFQTLLHPHPKLQASKPRYATRTPPSLRPLAVQQTDIARLLAGDLYWWK